MWYFTFDQRLPHSYGLEVQKHKRLESNGDPLGSFTPKWHHCNVQFYNK